MEDISKSDETRGNVYVDEKKMRDIEFGCWAVLDVMMVVVFLFALTFYVDRPVFYLKKYIYPISAMGFIIVFPGVFFLLTAELPFQFLRNRFVRKNYSK